MKQIHKCTALALALLMLLSLLPTAVFAADLRFDSISRDPAEDSEEWITVIVELEDEPTLEQDRFVAAFQKSSRAFAADRSVAAYRKSLAQRQDRVAARISAVNPQAGVRFRYTNLLNGFSCVLQRKDLEAVKALDGVLNVYECQTYRYNKDWMDEETFDGAELERVAASDAGSTDQLDLRSAWDAGYTGAGKVIAVFDSSLRYTHRDFSYMDPEITAAKPDNYKTKAGLMEAIFANASTINLFRSGWGSWFHGREETGFDAETQNAIRNGGFWYSEKIPFAVDYMDGDLEVWDGDTTSHGTHVCGIAAGNPGSDEADQDGVRGAAYDAQILFFKVFSEQDDYAQESDEAVFAALDDAVTLGANAFNLSLGIDYGFSTMQSYAQGGYQKAYARAQAAGIAVAVSAGNSARDVPGGAMANAESTMFPNRYALGFSGSLLAPMTVASAQGTGYTQYTQTTTTTISFEGAAPIEITDSNDRPFGEAFPGSYAVVDIGLGSEDEILEATGAERLEGALSGKIAFVTRGGISLAQKGANALRAGASAMLMMNSGGGTTVLSPEQKYAGMPTLGAFGNGSAGEIRAAIAAGGTVSFTSRTVIIPSGRTYADSGPSDFTSWGVTEALRLKPDVMAPGGSILSTGAASDTALSVKSGTSMAAPNLCGSLILIQQYVDDNLDVFGVEKGTQAYSNLVNQLAASNTKVYASTADVYHSPRRQGAGMPRIGEIVRSRVVLHNGAAYDPLTGEAPRTKIDLYDQLGDTFDMTFYLENYNEEARTFRVKADAQTDAIGPGASGPVVSVDGAVSFHDAVITLKRVSGRASIDTASGNINEFAPDYAPAVVTVPARSRTAVTLTVALRPETMQAQATLWPNGQFIEGYVFFNSDSQENVSIPYMGFRGDWNQAPIFDFAGVYDDFSAKSVSAADYPLYGVTGLAADLPDGTAVLPGANQYCAAALPDFYLDGSYARVRSYVSALRAKGLFSGDFAAFSPNGDGCLDCLYANLALLRNAKALMVEIVDSEGRVAATLGPDYDYFRAYQEDGLRVQQIAQTLGGPYRHTMGWDGTLDSGAPAPDGSYTFRVYGMTEYHYLKALKGQTDHSDSAAVIRALKAAGQTYEMRFQVDTAAPAVTRNELRDSVWRIALEDTGGIQAAAVYYDGAQVGDVTVCHKTALEAEYDLKDLVNGQLDPDKLSLQAVDYAFNRAVVSPADADDSGQPCDGGGNCPSIQLADVDRGPASWYHEAVDWAFVNDITKGTSDTTFSPKQGCTREQVVTFLWRAAGKPAPAGTKNPFADVQTDHYAYEAILWAVEQGITQGTAADKFSPAATCTREQIVTFLWRFEGEQKAAGGNPFTDIHEDDYAFDAVLWAVENGVTQGTAPDRFSPKDTCTRAQVVTFLWRDLTQ